MKKQIATILATLLITNSAAYLPSQHTFADFTDDYNELMAQLQQQTRPLNEQLLNCILFQSDSPRLLSCSTSYYRQQYIFADTAIIAGTVSPVSFCPFIKGFCPFYFGCSMNCAFGLLREKQYQQFSNNLFRAFSVMIETSLLNYIILQPDPNKIDRRY